ncbi:MerR family transcriptional regulator [Leifsonia sp. NPDC058248]|uniref:MerR family transcriptional regulator n=1 Tax=Leifsonia sp. NPDC058248 TaxID=3346402 RepID=UPI0036DCF4FA
MQVQIGEFAEALGVTPRAVRHYESTGLLAPLDRDGNGYRVYDRSQLERAGRVRDLLASGLPTRMVAELIDTLSDAGGIYPEHVDPGTLTAVEDEWDRMCRCVACMEARRDALRVYLDALGDATRSTASSA